MTQTTLPLKEYKQPIATLPETAEIVGLKYEDEGITLRFLASDNAAWGQPARQIRLDRRLAEQLSRLLADELEDYA